ncbi:hypothetical protein BGZ94_004806 [Podila epigama]|nr:hypothetical protein BGZ94_004806 [Podila epigama]
MKIAAAFVLLASSAPSLTWALIGNNWKFTTVPANGLNDITFPINMANATHKSGFYFAQQFFFKNVSEVAYTGIQPREDKNGKSIVHAAFSSFQGGTIVRHKNCHYGADGGPGVSCAVQLAGSYNDTYNCVVEHVGNTTWKGTLVNTVTGDSAVIGQWELPAGAGKIVNGQVGFVEYYIWNRRTADKSCHTLPATAVSFFHPTSKTSGSSGGKITRVYPYGNCVGKVNFEYWSIPNGYGIKAGFSNNTNY